MKNTKELILEATFALALKDGFSKIAIKDIQEATGLSAGTMYYYFKDKDEILEEVTKFFFLDNFHYYMDKIGNSDDPFIKKMENIFYYIMGFNKKRFQYYTPPEDYEVNSDALFTLFLSTHFQYPHTRYIFNQIAVDLVEFYRKISKEAVEKKEIVPEIDAKTLATFIQTVFRGYIYLSNGNPVLTSQDLIDANLKVFEQLTVKK